GEATDVDTCIVEQGGDVLGRIDVALEAATKRVRQAGRLDLARLPLDRRGELLELRDALRPVRDRVLLSWVTRHVEQRARPDLARAHEPVGAARDERVVVG